MLNKNKKNNFQPLYDAIKKCRLNKNETVWVTFFGKRLKIRAPNDNETYEYNDKLFLIKARCKGGITLATLSIGKRNVAIVCTHFLNKKSFLCSPYKKDFVLAIVEEIHDR